MMRDKPPYRKTGKTRPSWWVKKPIDKVSEPELSKLEYIPPPLMDGSQLTVDSLKKTMDEMPAPTRDELLYGDWMPPEMEDNTNG